MAGRWRATHPRVAAAQEEDLEDCRGPSGRCLVFPLAHRPRPRTANGQERLNQELKRRTRVGYIFPNTAVCLRLVTALCIEQSDVWVSGRRYLDLGEMVDGASAAGGQLRRQGVEEFTELPGLDPVSLP